MRAPLATVVLALAGTGLLALALALNAFKGTTPWGPLVLVAVVVLGGALLLLRLTGRSGYAWAYSLFVLGIASAAFGMIATVAFVWAAPLLLSALALLVATAKTPRQIRDDSAPDGGSGVGNHSGHRVQGK